MTIRAKMKQLLEGLRNEPKIGKFEKGRKGQTVTAPILIDGQEIGYVARRTTGGSSHDIVLTAAAPGGAWEITDLEDMKQVRAELMSHLSRAKKL